MYKSVKKVTKLPIRAIDGVIGKIDELLFDDQNWAVRYIVVDIGTFLIPKRVLISPVAVESILEDAILVKNTKEQIRSSPDVITAQPVSRQKEQELHDYYSWPYYWVYPGNYNSLGGALYPGLTNPEAYMQEPLTAEALEKDKQLEEQTRQSHLRLTKEVSGYHIQAIDEQIGHVEDYIIDDVKWVIRYLVVNTRFLIPGKKILIAPQWTKSIDWAEAVVYVDLDREEIRNSPEYDPSVPITRDFEQIIYKYYNRTGYWEKEGK